MTIDFTKEEVKILLQILDKVTLQGIESCKTVIKIAEKLSETKTGTK